MKINIRQEEEKDYKIVEHLTFLAFQNMEFADGDEYKLVANLRGSNIKPTNTNPFIIITLLNK